MKRRSIAGMVMLAAVVLSVVPAGGEGRAFSLQEAIATALSGNSEIRAMKSAVAAHQAEVGIARSLLLPRLTFEERYLRTNNPTYAFMAKLNQERFTAQDFGISSLNDPAAVNDFQTSLSFEQLLVAPQAHIGLRMARQEFHARDEELGRKKEAIVLEVFRTFLGVRTAKAYAAVAEQAVADAKEHLRIARLRAETRVGLHSDRLRADVALAGAEEQVVSSQKRLAVAGRALGLLLGLDREVDVDGSTPDIMMRPLDSYLAGAAARRDLRAMEGRTANAGNMLSMANAGYLPIVGIGGSWQMNHHQRPFGGEADSWQVTAFLRWELFDGLKRRYERERAVHRIAEAQEHLDGLRRHVAFLVHEAYLSVQEAAKALGLARSSLASAEEAKRQVTIRYENNLSPMVDLLDVQTSLDSARARVIEKENAWLVSLARLAFEGGTIMEDLVEGK